MSKYDISAKRLRIFDIENWLSNYFTSQELVDAKFYQKRNFIKCSNCRVSFHSAALKLYKSYHNFHCSIVEEIKLEIESTRLQSHIHAKAKILASDLFKQKKAQLTEQKIQKQAQREAELTKCQIKWKAKEHAELIEQAQQKVQLSKSTSRDIDIFDSTLICDILKFDLYSKVMNFLQNLQQIQHQYLKSDVFDLLLKCLRNFVFAWFKTQSTFIFIQNFDRDLACAFPTISLELAPKTLKQSSTTSASHSSPQYHSCVECFAQFFSFSRLLKHIKQKTCSRAVCKHCEKNFNFKNKLHEHIREQHTQKSNIKSNLRFFTSDFTHKIKKKSTVICSPASLAPSIPFATSRSQILYSATIFKSVSSIRSNLSIASHKLSSKRAKIASMLATRKFTSKRVEIAAFNCSLTSSRTSVSKHQKSYFTIDDLIRMFREKPKSFDLRQYQKGFASSQLFDTRSSRQSRFFFMHQSRIIFYFMSAANQKASISQSLKSSKSKNFQQHTLAKSIRTAFIFAFDSAFVLSEKSMLSPYKLQDIFCTNWRSRFSLRFSFVWFSTSFTSSLFASSFMDFSHAFALASTILTEHWSTNASKF